MYWALAHSSKCFSCFVLGKCSVNRSHASKPAEENKLSKGIWMDQQWYSTCIFWSRILKSSVDGGVDYEVNYFTKVYKPYLRLTIDCIWFDNVRMCVVEPMPNYVISSIYTSSLVFLDGSNVPIIEFISPNLGI